MTRVRIIGIGSWCGDDRIGWDAIAAIEASGLLLRFPDGVVEALRCDRPAGLLALLAGLPAAILIDAMQSGAAAGTVRRLEVDELAPGRTELSSHAMAVPDCLALGRSLGLLPPVLLLYGVEAPSGAPAAEPGAQVRAALPRLLNMLGRELDGLLDEACGRA